MPLQEALTDRYRPKAIEEFVGLDRPKKLMTALVARPFASAWLFVGPPGVGKTTMAQAVAHEMGAEFHHVPSRECDLEKVRELYRISHFAPLTGQFHVLLIDEAEQMTNAAQLAFLSKLDSTAPFPNTVVIFTANTMDGLEKRFLSRCRMVEFSSYGIAQAAADLLARIWTTEAGSAGAPDFRRIVKDSCNSIRDAINRLELEVMAA